MRSRQCLTLLTGTVPVSRSQIGFTPSMQKSAVVLFVMETRLVFPDKVVSQSYLRFELHATTTENYLRLAQSSCTLIVSLQHTSRHSSHTPSLFSINCCQQATCIHKKLMQNLCNLTVNKAIFSKIICTFLRASKIAI